MKSPVFFVGSSNPVKIEAVRQAAAIQWPETQAIGIEVESGVGSQPMSDAETKTGSENRAKQVLVQAQRGKQTFPQDQPILGVGLEGGVWETENGELWSTVWVTVCDHTGQMWSANGGRIKVPDVFAHKIKAGEEMGPVVEEYIGESDVRKKQGMFGVITNNFVTRTEEYASVARMAIGVWFGQNWDHNTSNKVHNKSV